MAAVTKLNSRKPHPETMMPGSVISARAVCGDPPKNTFVASHALDQGFSDAGEGGLEQADSWPQFSQISPARLPTAYREAI